MEICYWWEHAYVQGKRILLIIGGGIAAYKSLELIRLIARDGGNARAILTEGGSHFVTPLSVGALTGDKVYADLWDLMDEAEMGHVQLSRDADLVVAVPASADLMARMAAGMANDLATTALLATDKPVLIAPAMNVRMWQHPATRRNLETLIADGIQVVGPGEGDMACGEYGPGRMAEPAEILEAIRRMITGTEALKGVRALVTAGPTHEPIDPVRYIANRSSGKQGYAIASTLASMGAEVTLVSGPSALANPMGIKVVRVETADEMLTASKAALPSDVAICAAGVADWKVAGTAGSKLKKSRGETPDLNFAENPDILKTIAGRKGKARPKLVIGFAAETDDVLAHAKSKRKRKGCDWIVANDVGAGTGVMGGDQNTVHIITARKTETWEKAPKTDVAWRLCERIAKALK